MSQYPCNHCDRDCPTFVVLATGAVLSWHSDNRWQGNSGDELPANIGMGAGAGGGRQICFSNEMHVFWGCRNPAATNFESTANFDDGSCIGCLKHIHRQLWPMHSVRERPLCWTTRRIPAERGLYYCCRRRRRAPGCLRRIRHGWWVQYFRLLIHHPAGRPHRCMDRHVTFVIEFMVEAPLG